MDFLAEMDCNASPPDYENVMDLAVALATNGIRDEGGTDKATEHLLRASIAMATSEAESECVDVETIQPTFRTTAEAEMAYRAAYASERGFEVDDPNMREIGYWPFGDAVPLFEFLPKVFVTRVARAEAVYDTAFSNMAEDRGNDADRI